MQLRRRLKIASLTPESEYLQIRQLYLTVYYVCELVELGDRWSTHMCIICAMHRAQWMLKSR